jgi:hypothetical protein
MRRGGAGTVVILASLGFLICLAVVVGTWEVRGKVNRTMDTGITTLTGYVDLASGTVQRVDAGLADMQATANGIAQQARQGSLPPDTTTALALRLQELSDLVDTLQGGLIATGTAVDAADSIPGVEAAPLQDYLRPVSGGLARAASGVDSMQVAIASNDSAQIIALSTTVAEALGDARARLAEGQADIAGTRSSLATLRAEVAHRTLLAAIVLTLLFTLFAAGQISLLCRGVAWLHRRTNTPAREPRRLVGGDRPAGHPPGIPRAQ